MFEEKRDILQEAKNLYDRMTVEDKRNIVNYILLDPDLTVEERVSLFERPFKIDTFFNRDVFLKIANLFNFKDTIILCKRCGSPRTVKCGIVHGKQRYQCKNCNKTFLRG